MPKVNIYLPDDLAAAVKETGVPLSAVCQRALEQAVRRVTQIREIFAAEPQAIGGSDPPGFVFTARSMKMLEAARAAAKASGLTAAGTGHLLAEIAADADSLAMRVLAALEVTSRQITSELDRREHAEAEPTGRRADRAAIKPDEGKTAPAADVGLDGQVATVLELAAIESSGLGNSYIGSEHLLLGLIGEPDGVAGSVLRSLGAELRVTRRMVAAALAGWAARGAHQPRPANGTAGGAGHQDAAADQLAAAIKSELAPVLARLEQLEAQLAG